MATVTISLPDPMKDWIEAQAGNGQFSGVSDYIRDLVRQDQYRKDQREALHRRRGERPGSGTNTRRIARGSTASGCLEA